MTKAKVYHDGSVSGARRVVDAVLTVVLALLWKLIFGRRRYRYGRSVGSGHRRSYRGRRRR